MFGYFSEITEPAKNIYQNNSIKQTDRQTNRHTESGEREKNVSHNQVVNCFSNPWPLEYFFLKKNCILCKQ